MKKHLLMVGMILVPTLALAAGPDFNGSWTRNSAASDPVPNQMYWMTRQNTGGGGGRGRGGNDTVMSVKLDGDKLHVAETNATPNDYTLDGASHTKPTATGIQKAEVTARRQGDTLEINTSEPFGGQPGNVTLKIKEVWSLSPDGKTLTITTTRDIPARQQTFKEVYTRSPEGNVMCSAGCVTLPQ